MLWSKAETIEVPTKLLHINLFHLHIANAVADRTQRAVYFGSPPQRGEDFLQVVIMSCVCGDDFTWTASSRGWFCGSGVDRNFWCVFLSPQLDGRRDAAIQACPIVPIVTGHPAQPTVVVGTEVSSWSTLKLRAEAKAWLTRHSVSKMGV